MRTLKLGNFCVQLISVYPHLLPSSSNFTRSVPALHEIADVNQLARGDKSVIDDYKYFLRTYLEDIRGTKAAYGFKLVSSFQSIIYECKMSK